MPLVLQICAVVVTLALVSPVWMATRWLRRLDTLTSTIDAGFHEMRETLEDIRGASRRFHELLDVADDTVRSARDGMRRCEQLVDRATALGDVALDEIERPMRQASALWRGLQAGWALWQRRENQDSASGNGARIGG